MCSGFRDSSLLNRSSPGLSKTSLEASDTRLIKSTSSSRYLNTATMKELIKSRPNLDASCKASSLKEPHGTTKMVVLWSQSVVRCTSQCQSLTSCQYCLNRNLKSTKTIDSPMRVQLTRPENVTARYWQPGIPPTTWWTSNCLQSTLPSIGSREVLPYSRN